MYDIALTVAACLASGTRADVAWIVETEDMSVTDPSAAVVFTPGGGKIGEIAGGALDSKLSDLIGRSTGRLAQLSVTEVDALIAGLPGPGSARCLVVPADTMPAETWDLAKARVPFCVDLRLVGEEVESASIYHDGNVDTADEVVRDHFLRGAAGSVTPANRVVTLFTAVPKMVVVGTGPVAEAVARIAGYLGWESRLETDASTASGLITPLSARDMVVVAAHDIELAGAALRAALDSECGYLGSVGSRKMQSDRADWLAYRGVTDIDRIQGPAGLDIGADSPEEIAVAIVAEAIALRSAN